MEVQTYLAFTASELSAPLSLLRQLTLALDYAETPRDESLLKSEIVAVSDQLMKTIENLSEIERLESGVFVSEPVCVRSLCDDVKTELEHSDHSRHFLVKYSKSPLAASNYHLLKNAVYNFSLSALHFSTEETPSRIEVKTKNNQIRIEIRDFGPAVPKSFADSLKNLSAPTSIPMRPLSSGLNLYLATKFANFLGARPGLIRHQDGASFTLDLAPSKQASLL